MTATEESITRIGYEHAIDTMKQCLTDEGFIATPTERDNYRRVWGRDSCIIGLASLLTEDSELINGCRRSLETLARYQGPHGEIPSNVDLLTDRTSYGGTAGRVDANLWFLITCGKHWRTTGDGDFLSRMVESLEKVRRLLGAWEFNTRGLLYIPPTGDWADEYLQSGYVLYDQQCEVVDDYIDRKIVHPEVMMLPAFDPVITPKDEKWDDLQITFSHTFKNAPYEYHNGGLWPLVTGFYAASSASRGKTELASRYRDGIHRANRLEIDGWSWSFPE